MGNKNQEINYNLQCAPVPLRATTFQPHFLSLMWREREPPPSGGSHQPPGSPCQPPWDPWDPLGGPGDRRGSSNDTSRGAMWLPRLPQTPPLVRISFPSACHEPVELHNPSVTWDTVACFNTCGSTRPSTWLSLERESDFRNWLSFVHRPLRTTDAWQQWPQKSNWLPEYLGLAADPDWWYLQRNKQSQISAK